MYISTRVTCPPVWLCSDTYSSLIPTRAWRVLSWQCLRWSCSLPCQVVFQLEKENFDFFPLHRALSLQSRHEAHDDKIEVLSKQVSWLVTKMREQVGPIHTHVHTHMQAETHHSQPTDLRTHAHCQFDVRTYTYTNIR